MGSLRARLRRGGSLVIRDPRRLGGVELDPDESRLGPDAAAITLKPFRAILTASSAPLKARLMDQAKIAGIGNLLADDMLYRSGLAPNRPANSLSDHEQAKLHRSMRRTIKVLGAREAATPAISRSNASAVGCAHDARRSSCGATMWGSHHLLVRRLSDLNPPRRRAQSPSRCATVAGRCLDSIPFARCSSHCSS